MKKYYYLLLIYVVCLVWSGTRPFNYLIWIGEVTPVLLGLMVVVLTYKIFRFSIFTYAAILASCCIMMIGAHYTFTREPFFGWIRDYFELSRNNFDKVGHFVQGVIPVLVSREIFFRKRILKGYKWVSFIAFCICLSTTVVYELVEFLACLVAGKTPDEFLGAQGSIWDAQWDMFFAALGGLLTIYIFSDIHNRIIEKEFPGTFERYNRFVSESDSTVG